LKIGLVSHYISVVGGRDRGSRVEAAPAAGHHLGRSPSHQPS